MNISPFGRIGSVILAGGFGTRIQHLFPTIPKPMVEVCGVPFIEWVIRFLAKQGVQDFSLSLGYRAESVEEYLKSRPQDGLNIQVAREEIPLGTAGGFFHAMQKLSNCDAILATNGDSLLMANLAESLVDLHVKPDAVIWGVKVPDCRRYGSLECDEQGLLTAFREKQPGAGLINAGVYLFTRESLKSFPSKRPLSFETEVFPVLLAQGKNVAVIATDAPFIDIGTPETVVAAAAFIRNNAHLFEKKMEI